MGFTHEELLKGLPSAVDPFHIKKQSDRVYDILHEDRRVTLTMRPQTTRSIASITLPVTHIKLEFFRFGVAQYNDFMHRFKQYLQKGGG